MYIYVYIDKCSYGHGMKLKREIPWLFLIPTLANYITGTPPLTLKKTWLYSDGSFLSEFTNKRVHLCFGQEARARFRPVFRLIIEDLVYIRREIQEIKTLSYWLM